MPVLSMKTRSLDVILNSLSRHAGERVHGGALPLASVPSKVHNCAIAQCHQTICAVKSHSRALTFQILCRLKIA